MSGSTLYCLGEAWLELESPASLSSAEAFRPRVGGSAAALALAVAPTEACKNLRQMEKLGWRGEYGFYEAADYQHAWGDGTPRIVRSYMAHHQGIVVIHGQRRVIQRGQQILLHMAHLGGILADPIQHIQQMCAGQLQ